MKRTDSSKAHYIGHRQRLRERFIKQGLKGLHEYEALELLLTFALPRKDTKPLAKRLLKEFGGIKGVLDAQPKELKRIEGVGENIAVLITLTKALHGLYLQQKELQKRKLSSPEAVIEYCKVVMGGLKDEQFRVLYLNAQNRLLAEEIIQEGTVDHSVVYPRKVLEYALIHKATGMILVHNHPGGRLKPSQSDIAMTAKLRTVAEEMGIKIHDHFIITRDGYFSFYENGLL